MVTREFEEQAILPHFEGDRHILFLTPRQLRMSFQGDFECESAEHFLFLYSQRKCFFIPRLLKVLPADLFLVLHVPTLAKRFFCWYVNHLYNSVRACMRA